MHAYFSSMELLKINGCVFICKHIEKQKMCKWTRNKNQTVALLKFGLKSMNMKCVISHITVTVCDKKTTTFCQIVTHSCLPRIKAVHTTATAMTSTIFTRTHIHNA